MALTPLDDNNVDLTSDDERRLQVNADVVMAAVPEQQQQHQHMEQELFGGAVSFEVNNVGDVVGEEEVVAASEIVATINDNDDEDDDDCVEVVTTSVDQHQLLMQPLDAEVVELDADEEEEVIAGGGGVGVGGELVMANSDGLRVYGVESVLIADDDDDDDEGEEDSDEDGGEVVGVVGVDADGNDLLRTAEVRATTAMPPQLSYSDDDDDDVENAADGEDGEAIDAAAQIGDQHRLLAGIENHEAYGTDEDHAELTF